MCVFFQAEDGIRGAQESRGLGDVYKRQGCVSFRFMGCCEIVYHNPARQDTYAGLAVEKYELHLHDETVVTIQGPSIGAPYTTQVRNGKVHSIHAFLAG